MSNNAPTSSARKNLSDRINFRVSGVPRPEFKHRATLVCLLLALGTLALYWPARHYGFVDYDDDDYVFNNTMVMAGLTGQGLIWAFIDQHASNWHPVTWLSHMLDCQLFGLNPGAHHLVNVLFHCANAALLLLLLQTMTGKFWRSALVAGLFAWHPLRVESVAWISERKDVLCAFFFLLTLWTYVLSVKNQNRPAEAKTAKHAQTFWRLSLLFYCLGLLSKPMVVTTPVILLLLDFWPLQRLEGWTSPAEAAQTSTQKPISFYRLLLEKWPFILLSVIISVITFIAQRNALPAAPETLFERGANIFTDYLGYLEKLFWPQDLSFLYLRPDHVSLVSLLLALLVLGAISGVVAANLRRRPAWAVGWLWFIVMLLPVTLVPLSRLSIADRYTYLPSIGFYLLVVWMIGDLAENLLSRRGWRWVAATGAACILIVCAALTHQQLAYWQNTRTLMNHALVIDPNNYVAKINLHIYEFDQSHPGVRDRHGIKSTTP